MKTSSSRVFVFAAATGLAAALAAGAVYASGSGVINGCYKTQNGQLRVAGPSEQCLPSETAISWNQVGQTGPQGPTGDTGPTGPRGPSDAYDAYRDPNVNIPITGTSSGVTFVLTTLLPAGSFAITSKVNLSAGLSGGGLVHCQTQTAGGWYDMGVASIGPNAGETREAIVSTTFTAQQASPGALYVYCWRVNGVGPAPTAGLTEAVAIQVGTAHVTGYTTGTGS